MSEDRENENEQDEGTLTEEEIKVKRPSLYKVLLHNDDYTPMEFVIEILMKFFSKSHAESTNIMLNVHNKGVGIAGRYTYEIAETKTDQVTSYAKLNNHPLMCSLEKD